MRRITLAGAACTAICPVLVVATAPASAAPITGKLDTAGYTVFALAANGEARTVLARDGNFSLEPPAETVTLHLRASDGTYAGPVVLGEEGGEVAEAKAKVRKAKRKLRRAKRKVRRARAQVASADDGQAETRATKRLKRAKRRLKKAKRKLKRAKALLAQAKQEKAERPSRAILGVRSGAALGPIRVRSAAGYAISGPTDEQLLDAARVARARDGVPIGAGVFGRVVSPLIPSAVPGDSDVDGIPNALDIDDDGDLILDNLDASSAGAAAGRARAAQAANQCQPIASSLQSAAFSQSANVNAFVLGGLTAQDIQQRIDDGLVASGTLRFSPNIASTCNPLPSDSVELDCGGTPDPTNPDGWSGGFSYCTRGGTGYTFEGQGSLPFPGPAFELLDPDGDGKGTLPKPSFLSPRAPSAEIGTGDPLPQVVTSPDGTETPYPASLNFVFVTTPALASYTDSAGNCAKVSGTAATCATEFSYATMAADAPGNTNHGFPVAGAVCPADAPPSCVDGDVVLTLTFWRPQRSLAPQDPLGTAWMDIAGLTYAVGVGGSAGGGCAQQDFSSSDPRLTASTLSGRAGLTDAEGDQPASPANTFTYTWNLSQCYSAGHGTSFDPGDEVPVVFEGLSGATDSAGQTVHFRWP